MVVSAPETLQMDIVLPSSKSISNRALVIRALSGGSMAIGNVSDCDDSKVVVSALSDMPKVIDIGAAGTAMRFLSSLLATVEGEHVITGTERMRNRPIGVLVDALKEIGADICYEDKEGFPPLRIRGKMLKGGKVVLPGNVSSQYTSSLLMIGPTLREGLHLVLTGDIISRPYIDMTLAIMRQFGARAQWVSGHEIYVEAVPYSPVPYYVEGDWSAASYWYEMVALSEDEDACIVLPGLFQESLQGDSVVSNLFGHLGVGTCYEGNAVRLFKTRHICTEFMYNMVNCPDLAQTIVVTCCMLGLPFRISGLQTLRIKETDRISALQSELGKLGFALGIERDDVLHWDGKSAMPLADEASICIDTYEDHRMAMSFAPVALKRGNIAINNPEVVNKSYPGFWADLEKAGFKII